MIFDTHAHYDDKAFDEDRDQLLSSLTAAGVGRVIVPGCDVQSSTNAMRLAEKYDYIYFAAGIHPEELPEDGTSALDDIGKLLSCRKCVAVGEIGLDYYWDVTKKDEQKDVFRAQLSMARQFGKPVIIHDREAHADTLDIIREYPGTTGVFHCYSGSAEMAKELLKAGWYLGFDGPVTYKNARKTIETLEICPLDRILIETDSPYMSPVPCRGKRNDSRNLRYVIEKIAELKGMAIAEIETITYENACRLFGL